MNTQNNVTQRRAQPGVALWRWVRRLWAPKPAPEPTDKLLVILSDGRCALADNEDEAQGMVMRECLSSGGMVFANFRPATADEVAALSSPNAELTDANNERNAKA